MSRYGSLIKINVSGRNHVPGLICRLAFSGTPVFPRGNFRIFVARSRESHDLAIINRGIFIIYLFQAKNFGCAISL